MGIIALVVAILPSLKVSGNHLFSAEGSFFHVEKIHPRLIDVVKRLWAVYILLTVAETVLLILAKMDWFDAVCHSFATIATGGFSTKNTSLADFSPSIQYIITVFMFLAGMNFILHYLLLHGRLRKVFQNEEWKAYLLIIVAFTIITTYYNFPMYQSIESSFRHSIFQIVSILTATGFSTTDYEQWAHVAKYLLFFPMFIGACVGSTGGGIKIARHVIIFKSLRIQFRKAVHPNAIIPVRYNGKPVSDDLLTSISSFVIIYFITFIIGSFFMMVSGLDAESASSSIITTLGGIGPGFGSVGPIHNFSSLSNIGKYYLSFNMILGRLEIISVLSLFTKSFYKV
jgi:trk system potassium uptake protein TrkH